jgi:autotransporter-associated beta strand protein
MKRAFIAAATLSLVLVSISAFAGVGITSTWNGNGADNNWSTNLNWVIPAPPPADSDIIFPAGANRLTNNNDIAAGTAFATVTFNGAGGGYNLGGNSFGINEELVAAHTVGDNTIGNDLFLGNSLAFTSTTAGTSLILTGNLNLNGNTLTITGSGDTEISGVISGAASNVTKTGSGKLSLSADNTYSGATIVNDGELLLASGDISDSAVTVDGGTLSGSGATGALTATGGTVSPGTSVGAINVNGNMSLGAGSALDIEINGTTAGTDYDQIVVTGAVALDGPTLNLTYGFTPEIGDSFIIISDDGVDVVTGSFDGLAPGASVGPTGVPIVIDYDGGDGNDVALTVMAMTIDDVTVDSSDVDEVVFTVSLSAFSAAEVSVDYATADGTATAPTDYTATSGTLTFAPLEISKTIAVPLSGNPQGTGDKTFTVALTNPTNALISRAEGTGTIQYAEGGGCGCIVAGGGGTNVPMLWVMGILITILVFAFLSLFYRRSIAVRSQ